MKTIHPKAILSLKIFASIILLVALGFYFFRNTLLEQVINKTKNKAATDYDCTFSIKKAQFDGLTGVLLDELVLAPNNADTLFNIKKIKTSVNFWRLLLGDAQLGTLEVNTGYVQLVQKGKLKNFATFIKKDSTETQTTEKRDYAAFAYRIISKVFNLVPT